MLMKRAHFFFGCWIVLAVMAAPVSVSASNLNDTTNLRDTELAPDLPDTAPQFVPSIDDLPLMPGLKPLTDADTLFVVPRDGRIADSAAVGPVDIDDVYKFYRRSLPQLGWKVITMRSYERNGEHLHINAHADGKITTVHFSLNPG
jgi:hypothetical protein